MYLAGCAAGAKVEDCMEELGFSVFGGDFGDVSAGVPELCSDGADVGV